MVPRREASPPPRECPMSQMLESGYSAVRLLIKFCHVVSEPPKSILVLEDQTHDSGAVE